MEKGGGSLEPSWPLSGERCVWRAKQPGNSPLSKATSSGSNPGPLFLKCFFVLIKGRGTAAPAPYNYRHREQVIQEKIGNPKDIPVVKWASGNGSLWVKALLGKGLGTSCGGRWSSLVLNQKLSCSFWGWFIYKWFIKAKSPLHRHNRHVGGTMSGVTDKLGGQQKLLCLSLQWQRKKKKPSPRDITAAVYWAAGFSSN